MVSCSYYAVLIDKLLEFPFYVTNIPAHALIICLHLKKLPKSISTKVLSLHLYFQVLHHLQSWWPIFSFCSHQNVAADQESLSSIHSLSQQEGLRGGWISPGLWEECQLAGVTEGGLEFSLCTAQTWAFPRKNCGGEKSLNSGALALFTHTGAYSDRQLKSFNSQKHARNMENTKRKNKYILGFKKRKQLNTLLV